MVLGRAAARRRRLPPRRDHRRLRPATTPNCNAGSVGCLNGVRLGLAAIPDDLREPVADRLLVVTAEGRPLRERRPCRRRAGSFAPAQPAGRDRAPAAQAPFRVRDAGRPAGLRTLPARTLLAGRRSVVAGSDETGVLLHYRDRRRIGWPGPRFDAGLPGLRRGGGQLLDPCQPPRSTPPRRVAARVQAPDAAAGAAAERGPVRALLRRRRPRAGAAIGRPSRCAPAPTRCAGGCPRTAACRCFRLGLELTAPSGAQTPLSGRVKLLSVDWDGAPYDFRQSGMLMSSIWNLRPPLDARLGERGTRVRARLRAHLLHLAQRRQRPGHPGHARDWCDYAVETGLRFSLHRSGGLVLRSRGLRCYYAALFSGGRPARHRRPPGRRPCTPLAQTAFPYEMERLYAFTLRCRWQPPVARRGQHPRC